MNIGSMFAGIGGLDLACEWHWGAETAWQLDLIGADVRRAGFGNVGQSAAAKHVPGGAMKRCSDLVIY